jgi:putative Holliday junction resolvase
LKRVLGIDFGDRNVGLSLSDALQITAQPLTTRRLQNLGEEDRKFFRDLVTKNDVGEIVVGYPLRMDGSSGRRVDKTRAFAAWLEKAVGIRVRFWDERLSTHQALGVAHEQKIRVAAKKSAINQISAAIILQSYLDGKRTDAEHRPDS